MTIYLRADCAGEHGFGHGVRCRTLALALHAADPTVPLVFVTTTPALLQLVGADGTAWSTLCHLSESSAIDAVRQAAQLGDVLIVDQAQVQGVPPWVSAVRQCLRLVWIDTPGIGSDAGDLLVLPGAHYDSEQVSRLDALWGERLLVGAEYVLLRPDMLWPCAYHKRQPWLVVTTGGSDPLRVLPLLVEMMQSLRMRLQDVQRVFLMGAGAQPWLVAPLSAHDWVTGFDLRYLAQASVCVALWGTTVYEALALGTPTLTVARTASEAEDAARLEAATDGAVQSLGRLADMMRETLCDRLVALWHDTRERQRRHYASAGLLDGKGPARVAEAVLALAARGVHLVRSAS